ncbi:MAG: ABC transporter ATP-binding protein [Desulfobacterales bacterium]
MQPPILNICDLEVEYDTSKGHLKAVSGLNLEVRQHEVVGLVGESGCGKSSVARAISRLIPDPPGRITGGKILYKGRDLLSLSERKMRSIRGGEIALMFQDPMTYLNPVMKVRTQLAETIAAHQDISGPRALGCAIELLEKLHIPSPSRIVESYPYELSGGMRQRVLLAMAISCKPSLLVADEPTTALDVTVQMQILNLLKESVTDLQTSLLLITHDLGVVAEICDRVYVIYCGRVVEHGNVYQIFENPQHPYTRGLLGSALSITEFKEDLAAIEGVVPNMLHPPLGCAFHPRCPSCMHVCTNRLPEILPMEFDHHVACWLFYNHV